MESGMTNVDFWPRECLNPFVYAVPTNDGDSWGNQENRETDDTKIMPKPTARLEQKESKYQAPAKPTESPRVTVTKGLGSRVAQHRRSKPILHAETFHEEICKRLVSFLYQQTRHAQGRNRLHKSPWSNLALTDTFHHDRTTT